MKLIQTIYNRIYITSIKIVNQFFGLIPFFAFIEGTKDSQVSIRLIDWFKQYFFRIQYRFVYWPVHSSSMVTYSKRILIGVDTCPGYQPGCFIHGINGIYIGDYTQISSNVGIQSGNHDLHDLRKQVDGKPIKIGSYCLLSMNVMILPEVELGDFTIVGAGSIVTKSFPSGYCVIAGHPARKFRDLESQKCILKMNNHEFIKFYCRVKFIAYQKKIL